MGPTFQTACFFLSMQCINRVDLALYGTVYPEAMGGAWGTRWDWDPFVSTHCRKTHRIAKNAVGSCCRLLGYCSEGGTSSEESSSLTSRFCSSASLWWGFDSEINSLCETFDRTSAALWKTFVGGVVLSTRFLLLLDLFVVRHFLRVSRFGFFVVLTAEGSTTTLADDYDYDSCYESPDWT